MVAVVGTGVMASAMVSAGMVSARVAGVAVAGSGTTMRAHDCHGEKASATQGQRTFLLASDRCVALQFGLGIGYFSGLYYGDLR